jgi:hypothetical protein
MWVGLQHTQGTPPFSGVHPQLSTIAQAGVKFENHFAAVIISNELSYMVSYIDLPNGGKAIDPQKLLRDVGHGSMDKDDKIIRDDEITLDKNKVPGRDLLIDKGKFHYRARVFLKDLRQYQVIVVGWPDAVKSKDADKFLDSFEIAE